MHSLSILLLKWLPSCLLHPMSLEVMENNTRGAQIKKETQTPSYAVVRSHE